MNTSQAEVADLCRRWNTRIPQIGICRAVYAAFPDLPQLPLPINLRLLAARRRIATVVSKTLDCEGLLFETDDGTFTVHLNSRHGRHRQRFTLAHEIGHTLFLALESERRPDRVWIEDFALNRPLKRKQDVEWLCNLAAVEVLMPYDQFRRETEGLEAGAGALVRLASLFDVSLSAASRRFVQLSRQKVTVVLWEQTMYGRSFSASWICGRTKLQRERLLLSEGDPAHSVFAKRSRFRQRVWTSLGGLVDRYLVDGARLRGGDTRRVLTVYVLDRRASEATPRSQEQLPLL